MCADMLQQAGAKAEDSNYVAETLVNASLAGVDSHGIIRMERYVAAIEEGSCRPLEAPEVRTPVLVYCRSPPLSLAASLPPCVCVCVCLCLCLCLCMCVCACVCARALHMRSPEQVVVNKGSMALIDGKNTFGQIIARQAMDMCIEKVAEHGLALVSCVNTGHVGRVGEYALTAAKKGYLAFCCVNGGAIVAPFGSKGRVWGTNPICCAVPVADGEPLLVDLATSIQAEGKVMSALHKGAELPEDTIINKEGQPSKVPRELYDGGTIMTIGGAGHGHKGSALSMMVDVLGGVLSGTGPSFGVDQQRRP